METFDTEKLDSALRSLPDWKRVAFMALCCERMLPNFRKFALEAGVADEQPLVAGLSAIWRWIEDKSLPSDLGILLHACDSQAPVTEEHSSLFTSAALDCANAIAVTLEALAEPTVQRAIEVAGLARDSTDMFAQQTGNLDSVAPGFESMVLASAVVQRELTLQRRCLDYLQKASLDRREAYKSVRLEHPEFIRGSLD